MLELHLLNCYFAPILCSRATIALFCCYLGQICIIFGANLEKYFFFNDAGTAPSKNAIWDLFDEQHKHQSIK